MKSKPILTLVVLILLLALPTAALAQFAAKQPWTSTIYYYNPADESGDLQVSYYKPGADELPLSSATIPVNGKQAGEVYIGDTGVDSGFKGSAVLSASVPVLAVYEQASAGPDSNYGRLLYTAFEAGQGSAKIFIPSFMLNPKSYQSQVGVQPITDNVDVKISLYKADGSLAAELTRTGLKINESFILDGSSASQYPELADVIKTPFDGSAVVEVSNGEAVAAVEELQTNGRRAYAFEGVSEIASKVYAPSGFCKYSTGAQTTYLYIQNAGDQPTTVKLTAYRENVAARAQLGVYTVPGPLQPGARVGVNACSIPGLSTRSGSLVIESPEGEELAVVGKVTASTGVATAFTGQTRPTAAGSSTTVILPYVNWAANQYKGYRATISVMNVSGEAANVTATFHDRTGFTKAYTVGAIPADSKRSFTPEAAKALKADKSFRGAVEITSDKDVIVVVRLEKRITGVTGYTVFGEDYMGMPYIVNP